ncbi:MAG: hypothetical protein V1853_02150 [bacterium]
MENIIYKSIKQGRPFVYFHTQQVTQDILTRAIASGKSIELDISYNESLGIYLGHPLSWYDTYNLPKPEIPNIDKIVQTVKTSEIAVVFDCKDIRVMNKVNELVKLFGAERCVLHARINELAFKPYPQEVPIEPHWEDENLPFNELLQIKENTSVPILISCRGLTQTRLNNQSEIIKKIIKVTKSKAVGVSFDLPNYELPQKNIIDDLINNAIWPFINIDKVNKKKLPRVYFGISDSLEKATKAA